MRLNLRAIGFSLTAALRDHATRRARRALERFAPRVGRVTVWLSDVNGPRGGADKRCHVNVVVAGGREVVIDEVHPDLYAAIDVALARAARAVTRSLGRGLRTV